MIMNVTILLCCIIRLILIILSFCCLRMTSIDLTSFKEILFLILAYILFEFKIKINFKEDK